jgi:hypothetical protein
VVQLPGSDVNWTNHELTITADQTNTGWLERDWEVPRDAAVGDVYCQYWEWTPNESEGTGKGNSEDNKEQCVRVADVGWNLTGTSKLNGGSVDLTGLAADTCVYWTHTLTKTGAPAFTGTVNFEQKRTDGDSYGNGYNSTNCGGGSQGLQSGSVSSLAANSVTLVSSTTRTNVYRFSIRLPAGKTYCQSLGWTVPTEPAKNGQTGRLCASAAAQVSSGVYVSSLRACAVKISSFGGTAEKCVDATAPVAVAETNYAKTQDEIYFKYNLKRTAAYQSRQSANYKAAPAFDSGRTICSTNPSEGIGCAAKGPTAYTRPNSPGGKVTNKPGYLSPMMQDWDITDMNDCTLTGPTRMLSGLAPSGCNASGETELRNHEDFEYKGSGHKVVNADLGLRKDDLAQTVSLKDVRIVVHEGDTRTYTYDYQKKHTSTCSSASWGCGTALSPRTCRCSSYQVIYYGAGRKTGTSCRYGCSGVNGGIDATGSYTDQDNIWIEVMPDGPISAEVSFAIPYNYDITPQLNIFPANAQRIQIGGTELSFAASFAVSSRANSEVGETYATATKPDTQWRVVEFYLPVDTPNPNWPDELTHNSLTPLSCSVYSGAAYDCYYTGATGSLNTQSETNLFNLQNGSTFEAGLTQRRITDAPIGTKYCVSAAVMDYSSHNGASGYVSGNGYTDTMRGEWKMTKPECVSVGKMPMTNVIADGLYSDGKIEGATFGKQPDAGAYPATGAAYPPSAFGSWGEYEVVGSGGVRAFASGAALGVGAGGVPLGGSAAHTMLSENLLNGSCQIAPLTFANTTCSTTSPSTALGSMSGADTAHGLARNIRHRYTGRADATVVSGSVSPNSYNSCADAQVTAGKDTNNNDAIDPAEVTSCTYYIKSNGSLTVNAGTLNPGRSLIIEATGTVTVAGDIRLDDDGASNSGYTDISQIPQVMIFANNIHIDPRVTRVDAWLLAELSGGSGTINTCRNANNDTGVTEVLALDGNTCANPLRITGPVMASRVLLHRTSGAGVGMPASARPAEIFYLSPATYLWAYNQSASLNQAYLTYAREVAPRF